MTDTAKIANLTTPSAKRFHGGRVMLTCGVKSLPSIMRRKIIEAVAAFKDFSAGNDPHNEHDFGAIEVDGNKIFWNARVLTIMLAREY